MSKEKTLVLNYDQVDRKIRRIAHEIHEKHHKEKQLVVIGIADRGVIMADRLISILKDISKLEVKSGALKLDKDDPLSQAIELSFEPKELKGKCVVLVDDVLQGGMTLMHAASHVVQTKIAKLTTVVLVDRRHRKFPIRADIVGLTLSTTLQDHISVQFKGEKTAVYLD